MSDASVSTIPSGHTFAAQKLARDATFFVAGHRGLVGSAIWRLLKNEGFTNLVGRASSELDLRDREAVFAFFREVEPNYVVLAAAKVGGILANDRYPVEFLSDNLQMQLNVIDAAHEVGVERLLFLGSSCIYPKLAPQPLREEYLLTGPLEETNYAYAIAKIAGILHIQAMRQEYGHRWISAMPTNLYGPGDNFHPNHSHVLPSLIRRYDEAAHAQAASVTNWGTGTPRREFIHGKLRRRLAGQCGHRHRLHHQRACGIDRRCNGLHWRSGMGHEQARWDSPETAGYLPPQRRWLEIENSSYRWHQADRGVVPSQQ
jgi:GDP-L-fucose synthase